MATYLCFSDECGEYKKNITPCQLKSHPYYLRATLIIDSSEWKEFNSKFQNLKSTYSIPLTQEIKWAEVWRLICHREYGVKLGQKEAARRLLIYNHEELLELIRQSLEIINSLNTKYIIVTFTDNSKTNRHDVRHIMKFHIQELMQRVNMSSKKNLSVFFIDSINEDINTLLKDIYHEIYTSGDFIEHYDNVMDSIAMKFSHHSTGIQITDYICGVFSSILKCDENNHEQYDEVIQMFFDSVFPNLRRGTNGLMGYGIREIPINLNLRSSLRGKLISLKKEYDKIIDD